jgi:hypothetical protein
MFCVNETWRPPSTFTFSRHAASVGPSAGTNFKAGGPDLGARRREEPHAQTCEQQPPSPPPAVFRCMSSHRCRRPLALPPAHRRALRARAALHPAGTHTKHGGEDGRWRGCDTTTVAKMHPSAPLAQRTYRRQPARASPRARNSTQASTACAVQRSRDTHGALASRNDCVVVRASFTHAHVVPARAGAVPSPPRCCVCCMPASATGLDTLRRL